MQTMQTKKPITPITGSTLPSTTHNPTNTFEYQKPGFISYISSLSNFKTTKDIIKSTNNATSNELTQDIPGYIFTQIKIIDGTGAKLNDGLKQKLDNIFDIFDYKAPDITGSTSINTNALLYKNCMESFLEQKKAEYGKSFDSFYSFLCELLKIESNDILEIDQKYRAVAKNILQLPQFWQIASSADFQFLIGDFKTSVDNTRSFFIEKIATGTTKPITLENAIDKTSNGFTREDKELILKYKKYIAGNILTNPKFLMNITKTSNEQTIETHIIKVIKTHYLPNLTKLDEQTKKTEIKSKKRTVNGLSEITFTALKTDLIISPEAQDIILNIVEIEPAKTAATAKLREYLTPILMHAIFSNNTSLIEKINTILNELDNGKINEAINFLGTEPLPKKEALILLTSEFFETEGNFITRRSVKLKPPYKFSYPIICAASGVTTPTTNISTVSTYIPPELVSNSNDLLSSFNNIKDKINKCTEFNDVVLESVTKNVTEEIKGPKVSDKTTSAAIDLYNAKASMFSTLDVKTHLQNEQQMSVSGYLKYAQDLVSKSKLEKSNGDTSNALYFKDYYENLSYDDKDTGVYSKLSPMVTPLKMLRLSDYLKIAGVGSASFAFSAVVMSLTAPYLLPLLGGASGYTAVLAAMGVVGAGAASSFAISYTINCAVKKVSKNLVDYGPSKADLVLASILNGILLSLPRIAAGLPFSKEVVDSLTLIASVVSIAVPSFAIGKQFYDKKDKSFTDIIYVSLSSLYLIAFAASSLGNKDASKLLFDYGYIYNGILRGGMATALLLSDSEANKAMGALMFMSSLLSFTYGGIMHSLSHRYNGPFLSEDESNKVFGDMNNKSDVQNFYSKNPSGYYVVTGTDGNVYIEYIVEGKQQYIKLCDEKSFNTSVLVKYDNNSSKHFSATSREDLLAAITDKTHINGFLTPFLDPKHVDYSSVEQYSKDHKNEYIATITPDGKLIVYYNGIPVNATFQMPWDGEHIKFTEDSLKAFIKGIREELQNQEKLAENVGNIDLKNKIHSQIEQLNKMGTNNTMTIDELKTAYGFYHGEKEIKAPVVDVAVIKSDQGLTNNQIAQNENNNILTFTSSTDNSSYLFSSSFGSVTDNTKLLEELKKHSDNNLANELSKNLKDGKTSLTLYEIVFLKTLGVTTGYQITVSQKYILDLIDNILIKDEENAIAKLKEGTNPLKPEKVNEQHKLELEALKKEISQLTPDKQGNIKISPTKFAEILDDKKIATQYTYDGNKKPDQRMTLNTTAGNDKATALPKPDEFSDHINKNGFLSIANINTQSRNALGPIVNYTGFNDARLEVFPSDITKHKQQMEYEKAMKIPFSYSVQPGLLDQLNRIKAKASDDPIQQRMINDLTLRIESGSTTLSPEHVNLLDNLLVERDLFTMRFTHGITEHNTLLKEIDKRSFYDQDLEVIENLKKRIANDSTTGITDREATILRYNGITSSYEPIINSLSTSVSRSV